VLFQSQNYSRLYLCFYVSYVIFLENICCFYCMYSWPICFVVLKLLLFWKHSLEVSVYLIMNYISYCSTWIPNYFCSHNLLAESKCVDIILYCQHHNHASYIKGSVLCVYCVLKDCSLSIFGYISIFSINYS